MLFLFWPAVLIIEFRASPETTWSAARYGLLRMESGLRREGGGRNRPRGMGVAVDLKPASCLLRVNEARVERRGLFWRDA